MPMDSTHLLSYRPYIQPRPGHGTAFDVVSSFGYASHHWQSDNVQRQLSSSSLSTTSVEVSLRFDAQVLPRFFDAQSSSKPLPLPLLISCVRSGMLRSLAEHLCSQKRSRKDVCTVCARPKSRRRGLTWFTSRRNPAPRQWLFEFRQYRLCAVLS